jgi:uncharacterized glyoxalase superfamily protein PhnB
VARPRTRHDVVVSVTPALRFADLPSAVELYTGPLGFTIASGAVDDGHVAVERGDNRLMLEGKATFFGDAYNEAIAARLGTQSAGALYVEAEDLEELYDLVRSAGLRVVDPIADRPWGQVEFTVEDGEGNWLSFWKRLE